MTSNEGSGEQNGRILTFLFVCVLCVVCVCVCVCVCVKETNHE